MRRERYSRGFVVIEIKVKAVANVGCLANIELVVVGKGMSWELVIKRREVTMHEPPTRSKKSASVLPFFSILAK